MSKALLCAPELAIVRKGPWRIAAREDAPVEALVEALAQPGQPLKRSRKSSVVRAGDWVIKRSSGRAIARTGRLSFRRARARGAWFAAHRLLAAGVRVPAPIAFAERRRLGLVTDSAMISAYLDGYRNVEHFMQALVRNAGGGADTIADFLARLAVAVARLVDTGAYHADLSGKNIFTLDGTQFVFIDLDAVKFDIEYTDDLRLKNHVQLYDSFCDMVGDKLLVPFVQGMLTPSHDLRVWMPKVRSGQAKRRATIEAKWARQRAKRA